MRRTVMIPALISCALGGAACRSAVAEFYEDLLTAQGTGSTSGTGGGGGLPDECLGDPVKDPSLVRDGCGVFVDGSTATNGDGTKASPFKTVLAATKSSAARIFVCAGDYLEEETLDLTNGVSVYGGFGSCPGDGNWVWEDGERTSITGPQNQPAMRVTAGVSHIEAVDVTAPAGTLPGASSVALVVDGAELALVNVALTAGPGADGADGEVPEAVPPNGMDADAATASKACFANIVGGTGGVTVCEDGETRGGDGGKGGTVPANDGQPGVNGEPLPNPNPGGDGLGGVVDAGFCDDGEKGKAGEPGAPGNGGASIGTLTSNGLTGGDGQDGQSGKRGQGGGGGAGSKAGNFCPPGSSAGVGASGGGGGAGGCGGKGGGGGKAGGSSVGIVSLASTLQLTGVTVTVANGGAGGDGALGKAGGLGGKGADGGDGSGVGTSLPGCRGGNGGIGGNGGQGGGGRGGHSIGIAWKGVAPAVEGATVTIGTGGTGGLGDPEMPGVTSGATGTGGETAEFIVP